MPMIKIITNLSKSQIPSNFLEKLVPTLTNAMEKPAESLICSVKPDSLVYFNGDTKSPGALVSVEAIGHIDPQHNLAATKVLTKHFEDELALESSRLVISFYNLEASNVGKDGTTVDILLEQRSKK